MKNIFDKSIAEETINRINQLKPDSQPLWGKMSVAQMLAHCSVTYETAPYKRNNPTAPHYIISDSKDFEIERKRLIDYIIKTQQLGESYFDKKESHSFGRLSSGEWNNMFYKHLDHHLNQFGV